MERDSATAIDSGSGKRANSAGVVMLMRSSVLCADSTVATSNSKALRWSSSQIGS